MRFSVAAIGKLKTGPEKTLAADYEQRILVQGKKAGVTAFKLLDAAESQRPDVQQRKAEEEAWLWSIPSAQAYVIALDERGKIFSSENFASHLQKQIDSGIPEIAFFLGGPDGHSEATRARANLLLAFGSMTWPHRLARIMLLEQVYRACTIMTGHPYHRV